MDVDLKGVMLAFLLQNALILLLVSLLSYYLLQPYLDPKRKRLPPGPTGIPVFGYIPFLPANYLPKLKRLFAEYGSIISMRLGSMDVVFIADFEVMKRITVMDVYLNRPDFNIFSSFSAPTLVNWNGEEWKEQRKFALRIMRDIGMGRQSFEDAILDQVDELVTVVEMQAKKPVTVHPLLGSTVSNILNHMIMGKNLSPDHPTRRLLDDSFLKRGDGARPSMYSSLFYMPALSFLLNHTPFFPGRQFNARANRVADYIRGRYVEIKQQFDGKEGDERCFMEAYLKESAGNKSGKFFDDDHLIGNAFSFFAAGSNTTGDFLTWFFLIMMIEQAYQRRLRQEVDEVIGSNRPSLRHRDQMPYTEAVIHELHRLSTTVPSGIPHAVAEDVELEGFLLPKGTQVILCTAAVHSNPEYFERPNEFIPERFLSPEGKFVRSDKVIPFGIGKRACPGEPIANTQIFLFITSFLQKFEIEAPKGKRYTSQGETEFVGRIPADSPVQVLFKRR